MNRSPFFICFSSGLFIVYIEQILCQFKKNSFIEVFKIQEVY